MWGALHDGVDAMGPTCSRDVGFAGILLSWLGPGLVYRSAMCAHKWGLPSTPRMLIRSMLRDVMFLDGGHVFRDVRTQLAVACLCLHMWWLGTHGLFGVVGTRVTIARFGG